MQIQIAAGNLRKLAQDERGMATQMSGTRIPASSLCVTDLGFQPIGHTRTHLQSRP